MAPPSLDCPAESLLCWEDDVSVSLPGHGEEQESGDYPFLICKNSTLELATPAVEMQESDLQVAVSALIEREIFHAPCSDYAEKYETKLLDAGSRQKAISWLFKIPIGKAWMLQLLSVACLSLAAKMEEVEVPLLLELQVAPDCLFESQTIQRMELLLLSTLEWRVSSVTPFSYVDYFLCKCSLFGSTGRVLVVRISELILYAMQDLRFLPFQFSCLAAAAFLCAANEILPLQLEELNGMLMSMLPSSLQDLSAKCLRLMVDRFNVSSCPVILKADSVLSPAGVLDASFSSDSESTFRSIGSDPSVQISTPASKKRRIDNLRNSVPCNS